MRIESPFNVYIESGILKPMDDTIDIEFSSHVLYEVIRVIEGQPLFYAEHMNRLKASAELTGVCIEAYESKLRQDAFSLIQAAGIVNDNIKLVLGNRLSQVLDDDASESEGMMAWVWFGVKGQYPPASWFDTGVQVTLLHEERHNPNAKIIHAVLAEKVDLLRSQGQFYEGLLVDGQGYLTEGSRSNLFFIKDQALHTCESDKVLKGITRDQLRKVCLANHIDWIERPIHLSEIETFDGCFISGTSIDLLPIARIDHRAYASAELPLMKQLLIWYRENMNASIQAFKNGRIE